MRKVFLCTLVVFGFMNLCFGQFNTNTEKISVRTYDSKGLLEQFQLKGTEAHSFDIPAYIKENDHLERVIIRGSIKTALLTTKIKFDSSQERNEDADYICKEVKTNLTPFLGIWGTNGSKKLKGVDVNEIVPATSAAHAGITASENIVEFDGLVISNFPDLKKAVLSREIGQRVELKLKNESNIYSKYVTLGSRGVKTVNYKYCLEEQIEDIENRNLTVGAEEVSLTSYPNPTNAVSHVNFKSASDEDIIFSVRDIKGGLIHQESISNFSGNLGLDYNLGNETVGTYIYTIQQGKEIYNRKVQLIK